MTIQIRKREWVAAWIKNPEATERKMKCPRCSSRNTIREKAANARTCIFCMNCRMVFEK